MRILIRGSQKNPAKTRSATLVISGHPLPASGNSDLICVIGLMKSVPAGGGGGASAIMGLGGFMPASRLADVADSTGWCHEL